MSAVQILPHSHSRNHTGDGPALLNIARYPGGYSVELQGEGRRDVTPQVARAMIAAAKREGAIERVHCWSNLTTWHIARGS